MREDEFGDYLSYFIRDYTEEIAENFRISLDAAVELAKSEMASDLSEGVRTKGQHLLCVVEDREGLENHLGYIWYAHKEGSEKAFICDFHIFPSIQNKGFGDSEGWPWLH